MLKQTATSKPNKKFYFKFIIMFSFSFQTHKVRFIFYVNIHMEFSESCAIQNATNYAKPSQS